MSTLYRISWFSGITEATGHGEFCMSIDQAKDYVLVLNKKYPELDHWIEQKPEPMVEPESSQIGQ